MAVIVLVCGLATTIAHAQEMLGNGGMAISFTEKGQLESLLWPGSGGAEQLHRSGPMLFGNSAGSLLHGAQWGIGLGDKIDWQEHNTNGVYWDTKHAPIVCRSTTSSELPYTQSALLLSSVNVLALQLNLSSGEESAAFYWFQDFNPTLAQPAAWAGATDFFSPARDFAVYFDKERKTLYHFRPKSPSGGDREDAGTDTDEHGQARRKNWEEFGEGVWIGTMSTEAIKAYSCVTMPIDGESLEAPFKYPGAGFGYGDVASYLEIEPRQNNGKQSATVYIAIGESKAKVDESLSAVRDKSFDALSQEENAAWEARLAGLMTERVLDEANRQLLEKASTILFNARDAASDAFVHAPRPGGPAYARNASVWPGDVAWITEALLALKMPEAAEMHLDFCLRAVNAHSSPERPAGALPFSLYPDGRPGTAPCIADTEASAQTLIAVWRFARKMNTGGGEPAQEYLTRTRETTQLLAQFLAQQFDNAEESVAPSFQPHELREAYSQGTLTMVYLGLLAAREILMMQGEKFPQAWERSVKACESQIRFAILNEIEPWQLEGSVTYWMEQLLPQDHPLWKAPIAIGEGAQTLGEFLQSGQATKDEEIVDSLEAARVIARLLGE